MAVADIEQELQNRLDALQCGECTEEHFVREILALRESVPNLVWTALALIDQRYRRGQLRADLFLSIKSKIARHELNVRDFYGTTIELHPAPRSSGGVTQHPVDPDIVAGEPAPGAERTALVATQSAVVSVAASTAPQAVPPPPQSLEASSAPRARDIGRVLGDRYELESVLGCGGTSTVFKALDRQRADLAQHNRHVALKALDADVSQRPEIFADLRREFYCAQALSHPNVVKVYEIHHDDDVAFFTMELLEGELLSSVLQARHPQPLARSYAWAIIRDVGAGLAHAHSRGVVHGDLKPQNIMLTAAGEVRVLDFGVSGTATRQWSTSDPLQRNRLPAVTLAYACCELLDGQQTDPRDDLYSLACLSYELLAGEHPFQRRHSTEARTLGLRPRRPPGLTRRQWQALELGLSWHRESRSLAVRDWLALFDLAPGAGKLPPLPDLESAPPKPWKRSAVRHAALTVFLLAGLGLWVALGHPKFDGYSTGKPQGAKAQRNAPSVQVVPTGQIVLSDTKAVLKPTPVGTAVAPVLPAPEQAPDPGQALRAAESASGGSTAGSESRTRRARKITLAADSYRPGSGERFAEINVRRSNVTSDNSSFVWWTEAAAAEPGRDFVAQNRTTQFFPKGSRIARLFVRIVPSPTRKHAESFYVVIGEPSAGYSLGPLTRAAVLAPPLGSGNDANSVESDAQVR